MREPSWEIDDELVETRVYFEPTTDEVDAEAATPAPLPHAPYAQPAAPYVLPQAQYVQAQPYVPPQMPMAYVPLASIEYARAYAHTPPYPQPRAHAPQPRARPVHARGTQPNAHAPRASHSRRIGMLVGATCVMAGILIAVASPDWRAHASNKPAVASAPMPVVTPIETMAVITPAPAITQVAPATPAPAATIPAEAPVAAPPIVAPAPVVVPAVAPAPTVAPAPAPAEVTLDPVPVPTNHRHHRKTAAASAAVAAAPAVATDDSATGTLEIASKPPCTIVIDDKRTGLTTPQRSIELAVGKHQVTLTNADEGIQLTTEVVVTADHATRLIRDFTN